MRSGNVNLLFNDSSIDEFVDDNTNGSLGNVEDDTSSSVVVLEWHTLVNGGVDLDINIVSSLQNNFNEKDFLTIVSLTYLEVSQENSGVRSTLGLESLLE